MTAPTTVLPADVTYGTVTGAFILAVGDSADVDTHPDSVPASGSVTFTPSALRVIVSGITMLPQPITVDLDANGSFRVELVATDDPLLNPTGFTYYVSFRFASVALDAFSIAVPGGQTTDLAAVAPVGPSGGVLITRGPAGPAGPGAVAGGTTGQALVKTSAADNATGWGTVVAPWQPNTPVAAGQPVINPSGELVAALAAHTTGATYTAANWTTPASGTYAALGTLKQSGAVGDGVAVDTAAVQAALNRGSAIFRRGDVLITEGTYLVGPLLVPAGRRLVSAGGILKAAPGLPLNAQVVTLNGEGAAAIGVRLNGNGANQASGVLGIAWANVDNIEVSGCEVWATSKDAIRSGGTCNNVKVIGNRVRDLTSTAAGISLLHIGSHLVVNDNTITTPVAQALLIHGTAATPVYGVTVSGNVIDAPGQIPLEVLNATGVDITANTILAGNRGITTGTITDFSITGNTMLNQTLYAVEINGNTNGVVVGNVARNCAALVHFTSSTKGGDSVEVLGNVYMGSGLTAAVPGNSVIKVIKGNNIRVAGNIISGHEFVSPVIRAGVSFAVTGCEIEDNSITVDTPNAGLQAIQLSTGTQLVAANNRVKVTRALVAADDNMRVIQASQGGAVSGAEVRGNSVTFTASVAAAPAVVGVGTGFSAVGPMPASRFVGNTVVAGAVGFRADVNSADFVFADNEGRSCVTEVSNIDAAVMFKRQARIFSGVGAPTTGTHLRGDQSWETNPAASAVPGYVCVTGGTPGVWKAMAALAA